jgi:hypothetical protein
MRGRISYVEGYGWHVGRLFLWPTLLVAALLSVFPAATFEVLLILVTGLPWPFAVVWPLLFALWIRRRLRRKLNGEPFVWDPMLVIDDAYELDLVHRHLEPARWGKLFRLEVLTWGGALLIHFGMLALWWIGRSGTPAK